MGISDAYFNPQSSAAHWSDQPPAVAPAGLGPESMLQIYVPAEKTVLDYGAGELAGIRMATDTHVHLTARTPLTTVSLGKSARGEAADGAEAGLNIFTAGAKNEEVLKKTTGKYADKDELVQGMCREECTGKKLEQVHGEWHQICGQKAFHVFESHSHYVEHDSREVVGGSKTGQITGNHDLTVEGSQTIDVKGPSTTSHFAHSFNYNYGFKFDLFAGGSVGINLGGKIDSYTGFTISRNTSGSFNFVQGISLNNNYSLSLTRNFMAASHTDVDLSEKKADIQKSITKLSKRKASIASYVVAKIIK